MLTNYLAVVSEASDNTILYRIQFNAQKAVMRCVFTPIQ